MQRLLELCAIAKLKRYEVLVRSDESPGFFLHVYKNYGSATSFSVFKGYGPNLEAHIEEAIHTILKG